MEDQRAPRSELNQARRVAALDALVALGLVVGVAWVYSPALSAEFFDVDDPAYITENPQVRAGLTFASVRWSLGAIHAQNWHPVTWLSHQLDCQLFGVEPGGHHGMNVAFHVVNAVLVYVVFSSLTGRRTASAFVAALFAVHPVNVEAVAWVAERKTLLATLFGLLALGAYGRFVRRRRGREYVTVLLLFALSLASKPMLVTLPFVLLLLDYWPLGRMRKDAADGAEAKRVTARALVLEKVPLFALSLASCLVTLSAQGYARATNEALPIGWRIGNAVRAYGSYLVSLAWPADLAFAYPHPRRELSLVAVAVSFAVLVALSLAAYRSRRGHALVGWFWYLGTLVPMIGLVQVGKQGMADRYLYWPALGIFLVIAFAAAEWARVPRVVGLVGLASLALLALLARRQVGYWSDTVTLAERTLAVRPDNAVAAYLAGLGLERRGERERARRRFHEAVALDPVDVQARLALAAFLTRAGETDAALVELGRLETGAAETGEVLLWKGVALAKSGRPREAKALFERVRRTEPQNAEATYNLGMIALGEGDIAGATELLGEATRQNPLHASAWLALAEVQAGAGNWDEAANGYRRALAARPEETIARIGLALCLVHGGKANEGVDILEEASRAAPENPGIRHALGLAYAAVGRPREAVGELRAALAREPDWSVAGNDLAWILATHPERALRNGPEALEAARRAVAASGRSDPSFLDTLAAAFAECGEFDRATETVGEALALAEGRGLTGLANTLRERQALYRDKRPYRSAPVPRR